MLKCRLKRVEQLAQFAALYSDRIYIRNFFTDYVSHTSLSKSADKSEVYKAFADDIRLLLYLSPLIQVGRVIPITPPRYCIHCLLNKSLGVDADKRFDKVFDRLTNRYNKEVNATLKFEHGFYIVKVEGPESLIEHGSIVFLSRHRYSALDEMPRILKQIQSGEEIQLSKSTFKKLGLAVCRRKGASSITGL
jgi:hypothetical protein